jgi:two-component system LytT family response regulator
MSDMSDLLTPKDNLKMLVVDDEQLARAHLIRLLEDQGLSNVLEADTAAQALAVIDEKAPDVVFLDIQMPGLTGLQLAETIAYLERAPQIVFVTGYSEHAVAAFERGALDYLLKPVSPERLSATLLRLRERLKDQKARRKLRNAQLEALLGEGHRLKRLPIREADSVRLLRLERISCATAKDKHVYIRTRDGEYRTYYSLTQLESLLPQPRFMRIHASCIVDVEQIDQLLFLGNHSYGVKLTNGTELPVGRNAYPLLRQRLGLDLVVKR